ncbi:hypothetical protein GYA19_04880 [Candidatus Beckwithbacteria bacterium]|nr:hypothetical protein [Candidatus Beckwithbacteria bacterium]
MDTAVRELFEETGLKTTKADLILIPEIYIADIERKDGITTFYHQNYYCKNFTGELKADFETIPEFINILDLKQYNLLPNIEKMVDDCQKYLAK